MARRTTSTLNARLAALPLRLLPLARGPSRRDAGGRLPGGARPPRAHDPPADLRAEAERRAQAAGFGPIWLGAGSPGTRSATTSARRFPPRSTTRSSGPWSAARLVRRHRLDAIHARSHVPAATGLIVRRLTGCRLIFDIRGLLADEYVDAGRWPRGGLAQRITERVQARRDRPRGRDRGAHRAGARPPLRARSPDERVTVIPCCADLDRFDGDPERRRAGARRPRPRAGDRSWSTSGS